MVHCNIVHKRWSLVGHKRCGAISTKQYAIYGKIGVLGFIHGNSSATSDYQMYALLTAANDQELA